MITMWKPSLKDVFGILADRMESYFQRTKKLVNRPDEKGAPREEVVLQFLKEFLPENIGVAKGYIINLNGDCSKECDIVIFRKTSSIFKISPTQNLYLIPIEDVYGVIEVKSILTLAQYSNCIEKLNSFEYVYNNRYVDEDHFVALEKPHTPVDTSDKPFFAVFCYDIKHTDYEDIYHDFYLYLCCNPCSFVFCLNNGVYSKITDDVIIRFNSLDLGITKSTSEYTSESMNEIISRFCMSDYHARSYDNFKFDKSKNGDMLMIMFAYISDRLETATLENYSIGDYIALWRKSAL